MNLPCRFFLVPSESESKLDGDHGDEAPREHNKRDTVTAATTTTHPSKGMDDTTKASPATGAAAAAATATRTPRCSPCPCPWSRRVTVTMTVRPLLDCVRSIPDDLLSFTWWQATLLALFCAISVVFSIISFDPATNSVVKNWERDLAAGMDPWRVALMMLSGVVSFTGVLSVVLTTKRKLSCFFWGLINSVVGALFFFAYGYAGNAQLYLFFFTPMQFYGCYKWNPKMDHVDNVVEVRGLSWRGWLVSVVSAGALSVAAFYEIPPFGRALAGVYFFDPALVGSYAPLALDAVTLALNVVAQMLMIWRYWESWCFWLAVDVLSIAMWSGVAGSVVFNLVFMWVLFTINALFGLVLWWRATRLPAAGASGGEKKKAAADPEAPQGPAAAASTPAPTTTTTTTKADELAKV